MAISLTGAAPARKSWLPDMFAAQPDTRTLTEKSKAVPLVEGVPAATTTPPPVAGPTFTLPALETAFNDQQVLQADRQAKETEVLQQNLSLSENAANKSGDVLDASQSASDEIRRQQLEILGGVQGQILKANEAIALSDSNNPLDRFKLYLMQQTDPSYTAEGNTARLSYLRSAADALGQQGVIQQGAYQEQIQKIQTDLGLATMTGENELRLLSTAEAQGNERIQAAKDLQAARMNILQSQESMKQIALSQTTLETAQQAQQAATQSDSGTANLGGVDIPLAQINERVDALKQRDYLTQVQNANKVDLALGELTLPQLLVFKQQALTDKSGMANIAGTNVSLARIQDRETNLVNQNANSIATQYNQLLITRGLKEETDRQILQTMSVPELTALQSAGGIAPDGTKYRMDMIQTQRTLMTDAQEAGIRDQFTMLTMSDPATAFIDTKSALDSIKVDPASSLGQFIDKQKKLVNQAAFIADPTKTPTPADYALASSVLGQVQEATNKAITEEAKRRSGGDKNLQEAYEHTIRGQAIPAEVTRTALIEKVTKGMPATEWLDSKQHGILVNVYQAELRRLKTASLENADFSADPNTLKQMAAETAVNAVMMDSSNGVQDQVLQMQAKIKDNPLAIAGMNGSDILNITKRGDDVGLQNYISGRQLSSEVQAQMMNGNIPPEHQLGVSQYRAAALFTELEKKQPGLGTSYVKWWGSQSRAEMVTNYTAMKSTTFTGLPEGASGFSLLAPEMNGIFGTYGNTLAEGERLTMQDQLAKQHAEYVSFSGSPESKQVFLLDRDKNLTDAERQQAMSSIISPMIQQATQMGMKSPEEMTNYIETSLRQLMPDDPNQRKLVNKILQHRDETIEILDSFINISTAAMQNKSRAWGAAAGPIFGPLVGSAIDMMNGGDAGNMLNQAANVPWYKGGN